MDLPVDPATNVSLCDYTWLPPDHQATFQATLEMDDGIAKIHFIAAVEKMGRQDYQRRVVAVATNAIYVCTPAADIARCIPLDAVSGLLLCDEWIALIVPSEYDLAFRFSPSNAAMEHAHQSFFVSVLTGLARKVLNKSLTVQQLGTIHSLMSRPLDRPVGYHDTPPVPITVIEYADFGTIPHAEYFQRHLLPEHAAKCPQPATALKSPTVPFPRPVSNQQRPSAAPPPPMEVLSSSSQPARHVTVAAAAEMGTSAPAASASAPPPPSFSAPRTLEAEQQQRHDALRQQQRSYEQDASPPESGRGAASSPPHAEVSHRAAPAPQSTAAYPPQSISSTPGAASRGIGGTVDATAASRRFTDPCLELVWEELMTQKQTMQTLVEQVQLLLDDRYADQRRHAAAEAEAASARRHASPVNRNPRVEPPPPQRREVAVASASWDAPTPRSDQGAAMVPPLSDDRFGLKVRQAPAASAPIAYRSSTSPTAAVRQSPGGPRHGTTASPTASGAAPSHGARYSPPRYRVAPRVRGSAAIAELEDLTPFQRTMISNFLYDDAAASRTDNVASRHAASRRSATSEFLRSPRERSRPEDVKPPGTLMLRSQPSTTPRSQPRSTVAAQSLLVPEGAPHHHLLTRSARGNAARNYH